MTQPTSTETETQQMRMKPKLNLMEEAIFSSPSLTLLAPFNGQKD